MSASFLILELVNIGQFGQFSQIIKTLNIIKYIDVSALYRVPSFYCFFFKSYIYINIFKRWREKIVDRNHYFLSYSLKCKFF